MLDHAALAVIVFFVAVWNASVGPSGAITFAAMATILPPLAVVPLHAAVETASAIARSLLLRVYVDWPYTLCFLVGGCVGFLVGAQAMSIIALPESLLQICLGCTILFVTWFPLSFFSGRNWKLASLFGGACTSFLTVFVGATSPLVTALVQQKHPDHRKTLGTAAVCMAFQHGGKVVVFGLIGFSFAEYADLLFTFIVASLIGNWVGRHVLINAPQKITKLAFRAIVTGLALHLVWVGTTAA